jgi:exopolyphosphatase/guanosine-5'-triphosphate,3'-diphosphate pyrophosphatase
VNHGVIDIGSNTLLLLIIAPEGGTLEDLCRFGRLGEGLDATGKLKPEAIARSLDICREYRDLLDAHGVHTPTVIATQALREATNARDFIAPAEEILRGKIEVVTGKREAELAASAVAKTLPQLTGRPYVVVDVGGGSTEVIVTDGRRVKSAVSVPIGAVRMSERHLQHDPPLADESAAMLDDIDRALAQLELPSRVPVVGTAGTATTIAAIDLDLEKYGSREVRCRSRDRAAAGSCRRRAAAAQAVEDVGRRAARAAWTRARARGRDLRRDRDLRAAALCRRRDDVHHLRSRDPLRRRERARHQMTATPAPAPCGFAHACGAQVSRSTFSSVMYAASSALATTRPARMP